MKKAAVIIITVILSVFCSVPVFAAGNNLPEEKTVGVFAKSVYTLPDGCYGAEKNNDGEYIADLPNGIKMSLKLKSADSSLRIVIVPITKQETQAYQWISGCTADLGNDFLYYDIYFADEHGNRVDVNTSLEVSLALMQNFGTLKAAEISSNGKIMHLDSKSNGNNISFTIQKGGYYAVASSKSFTPVSPKTGDIRLIHFLIALFFVSGVSIAGTAIYGRKRLNE